MVGAQRRDLPFDAERSMALYTWGEGPTVLLAHGWAGRASQMAVYADPLVRRGFRVVAFDAPAHGRSDGTHTVLPEFVTAIERVAEAVGPLHAVIAHSLGAAATTMALARGVQAERVVFIAPPERPVNYLDRAAQMLGFSPAIARRTQRRLERRYGVEFDDARGSVLARSLRIPMLAIHDEHDAEVPHAEGRRLTDAWPGARLMTVHDLGHRRIVRDDGVVRAAVDFVTADAPYASKSGRSSSSVPSGN